MNAMCAVEVIHPEVKRDRWLVPLPLVGLAAEPQAGLTCQGTTAFLGHEAGLGRRGEDVEGTGEVSGTAAILSTSPIAGQPAALDNDMGDSKVMASVRFLRRYRTGQIEPAAARCRNSPPGGVTSGTPKRICLHQVFPRDPASQMSLGTLHDLIETGDPSDPILARMMNATLGFGTPARRRGGATLSVLLTRPCASCALAHQVVWRRPRHRALGPRLDPACPFEGFF